MTFSSAPFRLASCLFLATGLLSVGMLDVSSAQTAGSTQVPGQSNPGVITGSPGTQVQTEKQKETQQYLADPSATPEDIQIEKPAAPAPSVQVQAVQFRVDHITVSPVTLIPMQSVDAITQPYLGRDLTLNDLQAIVAQITKLYRDQGFLTTQVYVPPQDVNEGRVTIAVVEGKVGKFCVTKAKFTKSYTIARDLGFHAGDAFNLKSIEDELNRLNKINRNYRVRATLSPGSNTGETDLRVDVAERQPWQLTLTADNQGRPFIGQYRGGAELSNESLLGYGDRLFLKYLMSDRTQIGLASYLFPINRHGDQIGLNYSVSHVDVGLRTPNPPDIDGLANNFGLIWLHPFDANRTFVSDVGLNYRRVTTFFNDATSSRQDISTIVTGLNFSRLDRLGSTYARAASTVGIDMFGANRQFWKGEALFNRVFNLPLNNFLILRGYGQISANPLPSAEVYQLGGAYSVRGYTEGVLIGDRGYALSVEDRFPIPFLRHLSPWLGERLQGAVFFDFGQSFLDRDNILFAANRNRNNTILGTGFGFRARLTQYMQGFVDIGFGLGNREVVEPLGSPPLRVHFGVRSNLLSEAYKQRSQDYVCFDKKRSRRQTALKHPKATQTQKPAQNGAVTTSVTTGK